MKIKLSVITILLSILLPLLPRVSFAAFNTTTLSTDTIISVAGYTLNITGSSAVLESITVDASNFSVTLSSGSSITITSPTRNQLSTDITSDVISNTCNDSTSSLTLSYSGGGTITNTITPSATICATVPAETNVKVSYAGGGGGNVSKPIAPISPISSAPPITTTPSVSVLNQNISSGSEGNDVRNLQIFLNKHGFVISLNGVGSPGNESKFFGEKTRQAVILLQKKYGIFPALGNVGPATMALINSLNSKSDVVTTALVSTTPTIPTDQSSFKNDLKVGDSGDDILLLQKYLNTHGFIISSSGPGSPGNETNTFGSLTKISLMKFQASKGISATGFFGPITRSAIK